MRKQSENPLVWFPFAVLALVVAVFNLKRNGGHNDSDWDRGGSRLVWPMLFASLLLLAGAGAGALLVRQYYHRHVLPSRPPLSWRIEQGDPDPAGWGKWFPDHYQSYLFRRKVESAELPPRKIDTRPALEVIWAGLPAAQSIREVRGHPYSLKDVEREVAARGNKAGCLTCKSADAPKLMLALGGQFFGAPFPELRKEVTHPVSCSDCHDSETMGLRLTRQPFVEAYTRAGGDLDKTGRQEMRVLVCAQCHITYYFDQHSGALSIPWEQSPDVNAVEHYFSSTYPYREWVHAMTGTGLVKLRHPDYEFFLGGTHSVAGVACADCHMPFKVVGNRKITSHDFASPLSNPSTSCGVCHRQGDDYLRERVRQAQEEVTRLLSQVEDELVRSITMLRWAIGTPGADSDMINRARELHFRAFLRYDWVFSANSRGFHNPREALAVLAEAMRLAKDMQTVALQSVIQSPTADSALRAWMDSASGSH